VWRGEVVERLQSRKEIGFEILRSRKVEDLDEDCVESCRTQEVKLSRDTSDVDNVGRQDVLFSSRRMLLVKVTVRLLSGEGEDL
jgi:hypothetical protein